MSKLRSSLLLAAVVIGGGIPATAHAENLGVSAVPDTFSSSPQPKPAHTSTTPPGWQAYDFAAPNGGLLVFTRVNGNPACASYNGRDCLWGQKQSQIDFKRVQPLVCGADHKAKFGITGYENPKHWCSVARGMRG